MHGRSSLRWLDDQRNRRRLAEEEAVGGHICDPYYKSISTEDDDLESDWLWLEEDEAELLVGDEDGSTARGGFSSEISTDTRGGGGGGAPLNKRSQFIRQNRPATAGGAALRPENNAAAAAVLVAESSEPLVPRRATKRANDAEMVHHPFGCDRRGSESSSLLLVSS